MVLLLEEEEQPNGRYKNGMAQTERTHCNPKRHIPPVSLFLFHKMVVVHCFVWSLSLQLVSE